MNRIVTENIGKAREITLLGGRLQIENGYLTLSKKDYLREDISYYYFSSPSSHNDFIRNIRQHYISHGEVHVFDGASISSEVKYIPVLKCGNELLILNNEDDYFITDHFFEIPLPWNNDWDNLIVPVTEGCLRCIDIHLLPIKLSYKEISYLAPRLSLSLPNQLQIVLMPFHVACITSKQHEYHVVQIALENTAQISDYPLFDDSTFSAITHVFFLAAFYGACAAFILDNVDQVKPFIENYGRWWYNHLSVINNESIRKTLNDYVPILGWLVGVILEIVLIILLVILIAGIVPAIALVVPAIVASIVAFCTIWTRRIYLRIKKIRLFNKAISLTH